MLRGNVSFNSKSDLGAISRHFITGIKLMYIKKIEFFICSPHSVYAFMELWNNWGLGGAPCMTRMLLPIKRSINFHLCPTFPMAESSHRHHHPHAPTSTFSLFIIKWEGYGLITHTDVKQRSSPSSYSSLSTSTHTVTACTSVTYWKQGPHTNYSYQIIQL